MGSAPLQPSRLVPPSGTPRDHLPLTSLLPCRIQCCQPVNWVNEYNIFSSHLRLLMERESSVLDSNSFEHIQCRVSPAATRHTGCFTMQRDAELVRIQNPPVFQSLRLFPDLLPLIETYRIGYPMRCTLLLIFQFCSASEAVFS
jgi:hypothetical protein